MKKTNLTGEDIALIDFKGKNNFTCASYEEQLSDQWNVNNRVRQGGISSGILFIFNLNEVMSDFSELTATYTLNGSKLNLLGNYNHLVLFTPTTKTLQFSLNALTSKLYTLSVQVNVQKSSDIINFSTVNC